VVKVVVLMLHGKVVGMIEVAVVKMAFADSPTTPAAAHMATTPAAAHMTARCEITIENLSKRFDILDRQLGDKPYLTGEHFTIADAYAFAILNWTTIHNIDMRRWPRLVAFLDRVASRPAVQRALSEEGL